METDQNPEVPETVAETQEVESVQEAPAPEPEKTETTAPEAPKDEGETPSQSAEPLQAPPEPEKLTTNTNADTESTEKAKEVAPAEVIPEATAEPVKSTEKVEVAASGDQETSAEKKVEAEKTQEKVEQQIAEQPKPDKEAEPTQNDAAPSETPATEKEQEKPSEAEDVQAEAVKEVESKPKEPEIPLFFGWFLQSEVEERIKCSTMDFLKTLDTLETFKKHLSEFTGEAEKEVDLEQYFQNQGSLHCTAKFCDYGKVEGSKEYAEQQVVKDSVGSSAELSVVGLIVTPRTFGSRVVLTPEQLKLWPEDADKDGVPEASLPSVESLPPGSRAHVTMGCAAGVEAVQTGLDLLEILALQQGDQEAVEKEELELGTLSYLGQGRWYMALREAVACDTTFTSYSDEKRPTEPAKKEGGEKKKKPKCSIL